MKKRILTLFLAVMMVCMLLPFGTMAASLPVYKELIEDLAVPTDLGVLKDLDGDGVEELLMVRKDADDNPYAQVYTIVNGAAKKLIELQYDGPEIRESHKFADLRIISSGSKGLVVTQTYANTGGDNPDVYWREGAVTFYQLTNGELKEADVMRFKLLMRSGFEQFYPSSSTITLNGKTISDDEMNNIFTRIEDNTVDLYPLQQVYDALQGFFQDVEKNQYYSVPIGWARDNGITNGTSRFNFSPMESCTRGQVVTFLWRAAGKPTPTSTSNPFNDVKQGDYYYNAVLWAVEKNITNGTSANTFSPNAPCTRGQVVTFLWRNAGMPKMSVKNPFDDVKSSEYYYNAVLWAVSQKVTNGTSGTTFSPNDSCTRGQIVTFLYRALANKTAQ